MRYNQQIYFGSLVQYCNEDNIIRYTGTSNDPYRLMRWLINRPMSYTEYSREISISELGKFDPKEAYTITIGEI